MKIKCLSGEKLWSPRLRGLKSLILFFLLYLLIPLCLSTPVNAQEFFYQGKTIRIVVGFSAGGSYDTYSRLIARHIGKHIPGKPIIIVENMTGARSRIAANYLYRVAKPDGLTIGNFSGNQIVAQILRQPGVEFDGHNFEWIGAPTKDHNVCIFRKAAGITSIDKLAASKTPIKLATPGPGSTPHITATILKEALGLPIQIVSGYPGTGDVRLAVERGETDGTCGLSWPSVKTTWRHALEPGNVIVLLQNTTEPHPELRNIPLAINLAKTDQARKAIEVINHLGMITYPYALPPGTPRDRREILHRALQNTFKDREFLGEVKKAGLDINPLTGEQVQRTVEQLLERESRALIAKLEGATPFTFPPPPPPPTPVPAAAPEAGQIGKAYWNSWFQRDGEPVVNLEKGNDYTFVLDVSRYQYHTRRGARTDAEFEAKLREAADRKQKQIKFVIRPILLGGTLEFSDRPVYRLSMTVMLDRLRVEPGTEAIEKRFFDDFRGGKVPLSAFAGFVQAGKITFAVSAEESGCAFIALSIWDESGTFPLDHLVHTVDVRAAGGASHKCIEDDKDESELRGGLATLLDTSLELGESPTGRADAALHVFEIPYGTKKKSIAVFVDGTRYEAAPESSSAQERGVFAWELESTLSDYLANPRQLLVKLNAARGKAEKGVDDAYSEVAEELATKIFSALDKQQDKTAKAARVSLQELVKNAKQQPIILARMYSGHNEPVYLPLGLLAARGSNRVLSKPITVVQPLPRERYFSGKTCIDPWTFAIPEELSGVKGTIDFPQTGTGTSQGWREQLVRTLAALKDYLGETHASARPTKGEGFLLLAHHDEGNLYFVKPEDRIIRENVKRDFAPGSIAILSACSVGNPQGDNRAILDKLNRNGVDALIVSPFPIRADYGKQLSLEFTSVIRDQRAARNTPTLAELFNEAAKRTMQYFQSEAVTFDEMALEFLIAGDHSLRLCKQ